VERFLGVALFHVCSNLPETFVGIAMGKMETKGLLFSVFLVLFDVLGGDCSTEHGTSTCRGKSRDVEKESGFNYICWRYSDSDPCQLFDTEKVKEYIRDLHKKGHSPVQKENLKKALESSLELHLFMFAPISPRPLLVLPWEKWKQRA